MNARTLLGRIAAARELPPDKASVLIHWSIQQWYATGREGLTLDLPDDAEPVASVPAWWVCGCQPTEGNVWHRTHVVCMTCGTTIPSELHDTRVRR